MNFVFVMLFETCGTFAIRFVTSRLPKESSKYLAPAFMSSLFSFAILFVGDSALDPLVGSTLFYGCTGLPTQYFILLYWVSSIIAETFGLEDFSWPEALAAFSLNHDLMIDISDLPHHRLAFRSSI